MDNGRRGRYAPRDTDAEIALLDLDFRKLRLLEQRRKIADQVLVDARLLVWHA